jgi:hypothetical protein
MKESTFREMHPIICPGATLGRPERLNATADQKADLLNNSAVVKGRDRSRNT